MITRFKFIDDDKNLSQERKDNLQEETRSGMEAVAFILHRELLARKAENFFCVAFEIGEGKFYDLIYQKSGNKSAAERIRELEEENQRLKARIEITEEFLKYNG